MPSETQKPRRSGASEACGRSMSSRRVSAARGLTNGTSTYARCSGPEAPPPPLADDRCKGCCQGARTGLASRVRLARIPTAASSQADRGSCGQWHVQSLPKQPLLGEARLRAPSSAPISESHEFGHPSPLEIVCTVASPPRQSSGTAGPPPLTRRSPSARASWRFALSEPPAGSSNESTKWARSCLVPRHPLAVARVRKLPKGGPSPRGQSSIQAGSRASPERIHPRRIRRDRWQGQRGPFRAPNEMRIGPRS
jgi:hypothetical protein